MAACGCGGQPTLVPYNQFPDLPVYSGRPDLHNFPEPYIVNQTPYYQAFWPGNYLPPSGHNGANLPPFAVARADYYNQMQLSRGAPPQAASAGAIQSFVRRLSAAWSAMYGR